MYMHRTKMRENTSIKIDLQSFESENGASSIIDRVDALFEGFVLLKHHPENLDASNFKMFSSFFIHYY